MRYLLTGATGFVGGRLARQLVGDGRRVVAIVRDPAKAAALTAIGVEIRRGDVTDRESMRGPMAEVDGVFHVAGWYKVGARDRSEAERINVDGTRHVLELARELGVAKAVYTSTLAVFSDTRGRLVDEAYRYDGPHLSEYDRTKWVAHYRIAETMMAAGFPLVIVQPGVIYGPGDTSRIRRTLIDYLRRRLLMAPKRTAFCWAHVDDIVRGHILAMEKGRIGESYIIAGPPHLFIEMLDMAEEITGIPAPRLRVAPGVMRTAAAVMSVVDRVVPVPEEYTAEGLRTIAGVTYLGDNAKARRELGYNPRPLRDGLSETLRHEMRLLGMRSAS